MRRSQWISKIRGVCGLLAASALLLGAGTACAFGSMTPQRAPVHNLKAASPSTFSTSARPPDAGPDGARVSLFDYTVTGTQRARDDGSWKPSNYTQLGQANIGYDNPDRNDNAYFNHKPEWFEAGINGGGCKEQKCQADPSTMSGGHLLKFFHMGEQDSHSTRNIADDSKVSNPLYHYLWSRNNATNPDPSGSKHLGHPNDKEFETIGYNNVQPKLSGAGVPVVIDPDHPQYSESLVYLFDPSWSWTPGRTWQKTNLKANLLTQGSDGYWSYDSNEQWAQYDNGDGFKLTTNPGNPHQAANGKYFAPFDALGTREADIDHYFGMRLDQPFRVNKDGLSNDGKPIRFDFSGDDDVWVAIDGVIVLNMSGQLMYHQGSINITDGTIESSDNNRQTVLNRVSTTFAQRQKAAGITKGVSVRGGLTAGMHTLSLFYLERGNGGSNLSIRYNLPTPRSVRHGYRLSVSTQAHGPKSLTAGSQEPVTDTISSTFASGYHEQENLRATATLHWDGSPTAQVSKNVSLQAGSVKDSPHFTPQDFGWKEWKAGRYWFDTHIEKQSHLTEAVDTPDHEPSESWVLSPQPVAQPVPIKPNKTWAMNSKSDGTGSWKTHTDPTWTNHVDADHGSFRDLDPLAAVVNGVIPAHVKKAPKFELTDSWDEASYVWQPDEISSVKVYAVDIPHTASSSQQSEHTVLTPTVDSVQSRGTDVTDQFRITLDGVRHRITASLRSEAASHYTQLSRDRQITLLIPGHIRLAQGRGISQVRRDYPHQTKPQICSWPGSESSGGQHSFINKASQTMNGKSSDTNRPDICVIAPLVHKSVQSDGSQGGSVRDINGKSVLPGQKVHYTLTADDIISHRAEGYATSQIKFVDAYDPHVTVEASSIRVMSGGHLLQRSDYTVSHTPQTHQLSVSIKPSAIQSSDHTDQLLTVSFDAHVSQGIAALTTIRNAFDYIVNHSQIPSNEVSNRYEPPAPTKQVTRTGHPNQSIDGKTIRNGESFDYVLYLDASPFSASGSNSVSAYPLRRIGIVDRIDQRLKIAKGSLRIHDENGNDVTSRFTISTADGVVRVFASTADMGKYADLSVYQRESAVRLSSQVDQSVLGHRYAITIPVTLNCSTSQTSNLTNSAEQIVDDQQYETNRVSNKVYSSRPHKSVLTAIDGKDVNSSRIEQGTTFVYRLDSSTLPSNRAYSQVSDWTITDEIPREDQFTGVWEIKALSTMEINGKTIHQGQTIAHSVEQEGRESQDGVNSSLLGNSSLFTVHQDHSGVLTISATAQALSAFSQQNEQPIRWTAYIHCTRTKPSEHVANHFSESTNGLTRDSNTVWTSTPQLRNQMLPMTGGAMPLTPLFAIMCLIGGGALAIAAFRIQIYEHDEQQEMSSKR